MRRVQVAKAVGMGVLLLAASGPRSRAQGVSCDRVEVVVSPSVDPAWNVAIDELRGSVTRDLTGAECGAVRIELEGSPEGVVVRARTADGRDTSRLVRQPRLLVPVVLGLLMSAPPESSPKNAEPAPPRRSYPAPPASDSRDLPDFPPPSIPRTAAQSSVGVSLGLSTGGRVGVPTSVLMWDTELRADVLLKDWSVLALMRYAPVGAVSAIAPDADAYEEIGVGFGVGRQLRWGRNSVDFTLSPSVVFVTMETDSPKEVGGELPQFRLDLGARYGYALGAGWRFTWTLDSELAPSSLVKARYANPALPPVPAWTVGLRLGAAASLL